MNKRQAKKKVKNELHRIGIWLPWMHDEPPREVKSLTDKFKRDYDDLLGIAIVCGTDSKIYREAEQDTKEAWAHLAFGRYADQVISNAAEQKKEVQ